jgi:hypothetical protein
LKGTKTVKIPLAGVSVLACVAAAEAADIKAPAFTIGETVAANGPSRMGYVYRMPRRV